MLDDGYVAIWFNENRSCIEIPSANGSEVYYKSLMKTEVVLKFCYILRFYCHAWQFNENRSCIEIFLLFLLKQ